MEFSLVIVGSVKYVASQTVKIRKLAQEYGFQHVVNGSLLSWGWIEHDSTAFVCNHLRIVGVGDINGFRSVILTYPGVYLECPECFKRVSTTASTGVK